MTAAAPLMRSISQARITIISSEERDPAFPARMAAAAGEPLLRTVSNPHVPANGDGSLDLSIGLNLGCGGAVPHESLVGSIAVRERPCQPSDLNLVDGRPERLLVLEAPFLDAAMRIWRPPLGALLAATAAVLIATMGHDSNFRTFVACRAPADDTLALGAFDAIGARILGNPDQGVSPAVSGPAALRFLDKAAAARSAGIVLDHMTTVDPTWAMSAGGAARTCEGVLDIAYPRALRSVRDELAELKAGRVPLDWHVPVVIGNDVALPSSRQANAARS